MEADPLSKRRLKMWIRLLGVTRMAESHLREVLRVQHGTTLPRFDVMAALYRRRDGVTMTELSRMLLVSNGNATTVVDRLEKDGLVRRTPSDTDRRTVFVALTAEGLAQFEGQGLGSVARCGTCRGSRGGRRGRIGLPGRRDQRRAGQHRIGGCTQRTRFTLQGALQGSQQHRGDMLAVRTSRTGAATLQGAVRGAGAGIQVDRHLPALELGGQQR